MKITQIKMNEKNKNRASIFIDDEFLCALQLETIMKHRIKVGDEINQEKFKEMVDESEAMVGFSRCINLLIKSYKSTFQIKTYLCQKGYNSPTIQNIILKLNEYGYLNDDRFAQIFIESKKNKCGKLKIKNELIKKGIDKNIIDKSLKNFLSEDCAIKSVADKYLKNKNFDSKTKQKLFRHLLSKGFEFEEIKKYLKVEESESWN